MTFCVCWSSRVHAQPATQLRVVDLQLRDQRITLGEHCLQCAQPLQQPTKPRRLNRRTSLTSNASRSSHHAGDDLTSYAVRMENDR